MAFKQDSYTSMVSSSSLSSACACSNADADNEATKNHRYVSVVSTSAEGILHISERE